jgi:hypothetical protein
MANDRVLLITGPAGAGKSTVAAEWASSRGTGCVHLPLDTFRQFVKAGYQDPRLGWNDEAQRQLDLARANIAAAATNYLNSGFQVVIDDAVFPNWDQVSLEGWNQALPDATIDLIVLMPEWSTVVERNSGRGEGDFVLEDVLKIIYDDMSGWRDKPEVHVVDNSDLTIEQTAHEIDRLLTEG